MTRLTIPLALLTTLLLAACGGETGLTVRGQVEVDTGTAVTGFDFPEDVRIDDEEASSTGRVTGTCEMRQVLSEAEEDQWGIVVELYRGGTVDDLGVSSLTIMQRTDNLPDQGHIELSLGETPYTSEDGACRVDIDYAVEDSGMVGLSGSCQVADGDGATALVDLQLDIVGCTVAQ